MLWHQVLHAVTEEKDNQRLTYNMPCANSRDEPSWETQLHSLTLPERWSVLSHLASFLLSLQKQAEKCLFNTTVVCKLRLDLPWEPASVPLQTELSSLGAEETQNFWWPSHTPCWDPGTQGQTCSPKLWELFICNWALQNKIPIFLYWLKSLPSVSMWTQDNKNYC